MPRRRVNRTERLASQVRRRERNTEFIRQRRASSAPHSEGSTRNDVEERTASSHLLLLDDAVGADRSPEREQTGNGAEPMQWARADNQPTS
ncbi:unnamed protein product [Gongylonema pulchrum]|uniref:BZIP domain-containing protein n=1 Tax=Gongylonema pulchrum TaxID=637853 RepID=A0A183EZA0_9BILA|nr:unnamed protein product [Gongylonema pulchrum]